MRGEPGASAGEGGEGDDCSGWGRESFVAHNVPSPLRQKVIAAFKRHKSRCRWRWSCRSLEAIKRFVQRGNGVALVPRLTVENELETGALVGMAVPELPMERKLRLVLRRQATLSHAAQAFLKLVEEHAAGARRPVLLCGGARLS